MWPFRTTREPAKDDLGARLDALERKFAALSLEWVELSDKLLHRLQRQAKRDRDAIKAEADGNGTAAAPPTVEPADPRAARLLRKVDLYARAAARRH